MEEMGEQPAPPDIALLMAAFRAGNMEAAGALVQALYPELRRIASSRMKRERRDHTLQATALVNELYLELTRLSKLRPGSTDPEVEKQEFLRLCAHLMRRLLIHHSRPLSKRMAKSELDDRLPDARSADEALHDVDCALDELGQVDPKLRQVVEMKVFEGLSTAEMALRLNCAVRTVERHWAFARRWLEAKLHP